VIVVRPTSQPVPLYGEERNLREAPGFRLCERRVPPGFALPFHCHESVFLSYITAGLYEDSTETKRIERCGPKVLRLLPAGAPHSLRSQGGVKVVSLEVDTRLLPELPFKSSKYNCSAKSAATLSIGSRLLHELRFFDSCSPVAVLGLFFEAVAELSRTAGKSSNPSARIAYVRELLESEFSSRLCFRDIAASVGLHPVDLAQQFRRHFGCNMGEYVRRVRVERSAILLKTTHAPLSDIASSCGFADQSHMTSVFKRHLGITPLHYRQLMR
jgi:AraC family transcriptional regulator